MTNVEFIEPGAEEKENTLNHDQRLLLQRQMELAIEKFGPKDSEITHDIRNQIMESWIAYGYSKAYRDVADRLLAKIKDGETMDYGSITMEMVQKELKFKGITQVEQDSNDKQNADFGEDLKTAA